jgi:hypothetical protein
MITSWIPVIRPWCSCPWNFSFPAEQGAKCFSRAHPICAALVFTMEMRGPEGEPAMAVFVSGCRVPQMRGIGLRALFMVREQAGNKTDVVTCDRLSSPHCTKPSSDRNQSRVCRSEGSRLFRSPTVYFHHQLTLLSSTFSSLNDFLAPVTGPSSQICPLTLFPQFVETESIG